MLRPAPHGPPRRPHLPGACPAGSSQTQTLPARAGPQGPYGGECHDDAGDRLPGATPWGLTPKSELRAPGPGSFGSHALLTRSWATVPPHPAPSAEARPAGGKDPGDGRPAWYAAPRGSHTTFVPPAISPKVSGLCLPFQPSTPHYPAQRGAAHTVFWVFSTLRP